MIRSRAKTGRPAGLSGAETMRAIRAEGARLIHEHGYAGMSLRDLADRVGIKASSLYNHIDSKQQLLFLLIEHHMRLALQGVDAALAEAGGDATARLRAFVDFHIRFHTGHPVEAAICLSELRCLEGENRRAVVALRDAYEARLSRIIRDGAAAGTFRVADARLATFSILGAITGVLTWYRPGGRLDPAVIAAAYGDLLVDGLRGRQTAAMDTGAPPP